jgi:hypothetical protein
MDGLSALLKQLQEAGIAADDAVEETIANVAVTTQQYAVTGIRGGAATGRVYGNHVASAPGQYPASDTGRLMASINTELTETTAIVGTNVAHGPMLEFGTSRMAARPWLLPSFERAKIGVEKELKARLEAKL